MKILATSIGCPSGIGPEVSVKGAASLKGARALLVGDPVVVAEAARVVGVRAPVRRVSTRRELLALPKRTLAVFDESATLGTLLVPGHPDAAAGRAQLAWIDQATDLVREGVADALVTGPVSKHAIATSGARGGAQFLGHTEHLARRLKSREVVMAFWTEELTSALATTHVRLADVPRRVTPNAVAMATYWLARLLEDLGERAPSIAVASLNPHAGEGGLLGDEEIRRIAPGLERARARLAKERRRAVIHEPIGAESAFRKARDGVYSGVVAMYHDQATIPMKLLAFGEAVNVTLGLPIVRTSVDHGTGYDIAWKGKADATGMQAAMRLATKLIRR